MKYVYWDSNCFIGYLQNEPDTADVLENIIRLAEDGVLRIVTSAFTITEVVKFKGADGVLRKPIGSEEEAYLDSCFSPESGIITTNVDIVTARMARRAIWELDVDTKDSVHVASAMQFKRSGLMKDGDELVFHTFDKKLLKKADGVDNIRFEAPKIEDYPYQQEFDLE